MGELKPGVYEHYKGGRYLVLGVATYSEDGGKLVVYVPLYEAHFPLWALPLGRFTDVLPEGRPRFRSLYSHPLTDQLRGHLTAATKEPKDD